MFRAVDVAEAIADFQRALHVGGLHGAVVVVDEDVSSGAGELDACEGIIQASRAGIAHGERAVAILDVGAP